ncbi:sulfatase-like hydrolase/transferase [Mediterraneibacter sp.]|jgi:phosphoglycerol transferase|uniref:sulfatase-like hydrolase/transferase n=1 Tax=Mediterraneibacter sp. TaxID=2316022 RepID=UPI0027B88EE6|nr:sulfatase-like hydrolase/transferase [Mediterraneibacter sp.]
MGIVQKLIKYLGTVLSIIMVGITILLGFSVRWMFKTWPNLAVDELVFHLTEPLDGTNQDMIIEYIMQCIIPMVFVLILFSVFLIIKRKTKYYNSFVITGIFLSMGGIVISLYVAWEKIGIGEYLYNQFAKSSFIEEHYIDPKMADLEFPEQKRNLIYIYLESMETTYADENSGGAFSENYIPELTKLAQENEDFSGESANLNGGHTVEGTTWTMAGLFAQTSGIPLKTNINANNMDTQEHFFPGIMTLGDILKEQGYSQTLLIGSKAEFGGRKVYFTEHGDYFMDDYDYAIESAKIPSDYKVWWGYEDEKLFEFAKEKCTELSRQEEPFNLTMLTADTHFEDGYVCEKCSNDYEDQYANVMACSSKQVYEFIEWVKQQPFYENTTIVLSGDHLTMDSDFCAKVDEEEEYDRRTYTAYINSAVNPINNMKRMYTTMDNFPTTLAAMGVKIEGNRLGLGTNLFSDQPTLMESVGEEMLKAELKKKSEFLEEISGIDKNNETVLIREGKKEGAYIETKVESDSIKVSIEKIDPAIKEKINTIVLAVWTEEGQRDLQWIDAEKISETEYEANIKFDLFNNAKGKYYIDVRAIEFTDVEYVIGSTACKVK